MRDVVAPPEARTGTCTDCGGPCDHRSPRCRACYDLTRPAKRYKVIRKPGHPLANGVGCVYLHRYLLFEAGISIPDGAHVHHRNGDIHDNRIENLQVLDANDHRRLHGASLTDAQRNGLRLGGIVSGQKRRARTTHCPHGHAYDEANTYYDANGGRQCRACTRDRMRRKRAVA